MIFFVLPCLVDRFLAAHWFGVEALPRHVINVDISQKVGTSRIYVIYVVSRVNFVLKKHIVYPCPTHESFHRRHGLDPWRLTWKHNHGGLEDRFSFLIGWFICSMFIFQGVCPWICECCLFFVGSFDTPKETNFCHQLYPSSNLFHSTIGIRSTFFKYQQTPPDYGDLRIRS